MNVVFFLFVLTLVLELLLGLGLLISYVFPKHRLWPPPKRGSWQYWYIHLSTEGGIFCFLVLGFVDWNTFLFAHWVWFVLAFCLMIPGLAVFLWAFRTLTIQTSLGQKGKLTTKGPYSYSRNPQYLGFIIFLLGAILFFNSFFAAIVGFVGIVLFLFAPFVEEPWLKEQFKQEYYDYCRRAPRFF